MNRKEQSRKIIGDLLGKNNMDVARGQVMSVRDRAINALRMTKILFGAIAAAIALLESTHAFADVGRTQGNFDVSPNGAATYHIPIFTPPGPNGVQPSISLEYSSQSDYLVDAPPSYLGIQDRIMGVGWNLSAVSSIARCHKSIAQDGAAGGILINATDVFCLNGNRLRVSSGAYGAANSTYLTEVADYSQITAFGAAGTGPQYFTVKAKNGWTYEYGNSANSRVLQASTGTAIRWLLNKASDRYGNNYVVTYEQDAANNIAVPLTISWAPTGSSGYLHTITFGYNRSRPDPGYGYLFGTLLTNTYRLETITLQTSGATIKKYWLKYAPSPSTGRSRLTQVHECADDNESTCLAPTVFAYQDGAGFVTPSTSTAVTNLLRGSYDFDGDGKKDLAYANAGTIWVQFSTNAGFLPAKNTGIASTTPLVIDSFVIKGRDGFLINESGNLYHVRWNSATSAFVKSSVNLSYTNGNLPEVLDTDGDGLADLVWMQSAVVNVRRNVTPIGSVDPTFAASPVGTTRIDQATLGAGPNGYSWNPSSIQATQALGLGLRHYDVNGDGRQDPHVVVVVMTSPTNGMPYSFTMLSQGTSFYIPPANTWVPLGQNSAIRFNDDACTDRYAGTTIYISACNGVAGATLSAPNGMLLDWDGDGRTDILDYSGSTLSVRRSLGTSLAAPTTTSIPSAGSYYSFDKDGDGMEDLIRVNTDGTVTYYAHGNVGSTTIYIKDIPDLLASVTDGYGFAIAPEFISTARTNYYHGTFPAAGSDSLQTLIEPDYPVIAVGRVTIDDGIGGNYTQSYTYTGLRYEKDREASAGFQQVDVVDSRNGVITKTYYDQGFPITGMVRKAEVYQANGTSLVSRTTITNTYQTLETDASGRLIRVNPYVSEVLAENQEVGGAKDASPLTMIDTKYENLDANGNVGKISQIVTDQDNSLVAGQQWITITNNTFAPPAAQCVDFLTDSAVSTTAPGGSVVTRSVHNEPDTANCRASSSTVEPSSTKYRVDTTYGYDSFGNVNSITVTGKDIDQTTISRVTTISWGVLGIFPTTVTNALNQTTGFDYYYGLGLPKSVTDPNSLATSWQYDSFGRKKTEVRPDGSSTTWTYLSCGGACVTAQHKMNVTKTDSTGAESIAYLDQFDRVIVTRTKLMDGTYQWNEVQYNASGQLAKQSIPCSTSSATASCAGNWISNLYDGLGRPKSSSRPIDGLHSGTQTTTIDYLGRTTIVTDPQGKTSTKITDPTGAMRVSTDANNYSQSFTYDAAGSLTAVTDSNGKSLFSATYDYGIAAFQVTASDPDLGSRTQAYNSLGELRSWTDASNQSFTAQYDPLSRMISRVDPATASTAATSSSWVWGSDPAKHNIGRLESMSATSSAGTYADEYVYNGLGQLSQRQITIPGDPVYTYDFAYTTSGLLDTLTYPTSTNSYRLALKYGYSSANGQLQTVGDANASSTVFWTANAQNARGQITQDTLGSGIVRTRAFDAITGWLSSIQAGPSANLTALQNTSYLYDLVGNVTQRQNNKLSLTENFYYGNSADNLYRLDHSTVTVNGTTTTNLSLTYDSIGNILTKNETGAQDAAVDHSITWTSFNFPASITAATTGEAASFSYGPDRQRWRMVFTAPSANETTYYIGGLLEKVVSGAVTDYRHYINVGGESIAIYSRTAAGSNTVRYVLGNHQGSMDTIASSSGGVVMDESFTAYGLRRDAATWSGAPSASDRSTADSITRQGYTFQTVLGMMGLNHMNGRVQDAINGRFLSPDPFVTEPGYTQNFNRYAYVYNNPLTNVDPTGYARQCTKTVVKEAETVTITGGEGGPIKYHTPAITAEICIDIPDPSVDGLPPYPAPDPNPNPHPEPPTNGKRETNSKCIRRLVDWGNYLMRVSENAGDASETLTLSGLGTMGVGAVTLQPEVIGVGGAIAETGGFAGIAAGFVQFMGGLLQGWGGAGYDNAINGAVSVAGGFALKYSVLGAEAQATSASQRAVRESLEKTQTVVGGSYDLMQELIEELKPKEKTCPEN